LRDGGTTHLDFAANQLYAHANFTSPGLYSNSTSAGTSGDFFATGQLVAGLYAVSQTNTDHLVVQQNYSYEGQYTQNVIKDGFGTFTGFHRVYTDDTLFNESNPDIFRNNYMGRVVISTGKIKTDLTNDEGENPIWYSAIDKDGITIEDALPIIQLSRNKKDKRVFGVLGDPKRNSNNPNRLIVNSVGEGAICVSNTNGNIENGDYIQSSDLLGYGEKQNDDLLHNYTIAKSTINCNFELDSPYFQCHEIENGVRVAFIACSYHCG
jgi:outer membrane protein assembly factor BamB